jgi:hypothetical protein
MGLGLSTSRETRSTRCSTTELRLRGEAKLYPLLPLVRFYSIQPASSVRSGAMDLSGSRGVLTTHPVKGMPLGRLGPQGS